MLRFNNKSFMAKVLRKAIMYIDLIYKIYIINLGQIKIVLAIKSK